MQEVDSQINPLQELTKAIALAGSMFSLSKLSGINRRTLAYNYTKKHTTCIANILRLKNFVDQNMNKEKNNLNEKGL